MVGSYTRQATSKRAMRYGHPMRSPIPLPTPDSFRARRSTNRPFGLSGSVVGKPGCLGPNQTFPASVNVARIQSAPKRPRSTVCRSSILDSSLMSPPIDSSQPRLGLNGGYSWHCPVLVVADANHAHWRRHHCRSGGQRAPQSIDQSGGPILRPV